MAPPVCFVISSHVAASSVGLRAVEAGLAAWGVSAIAVPTVTLGRHPGWGPPGGGAVASPQFSSSLDGALSHPDAKRAAWAVTGYFADARQVAAAADAVERLKGEARDLKVCVDPIMGDEDTGRYVAEDVPKAIERRLLPLADLVTPNAWEVEQLTGVRVIDPASAAAAARALGVAAAVTSVRESDRIGAVYADGKDALFGHGPVRETKVRGAGDLFAGSIVGALTQGRRDEISLSATLAIVDNALEMCAATRQPEISLLRVAALGAAFPPTGNSDLVQIKRI